jgi:hypothetical protein
VRTLLPAIVSRPSELPALFALESTLLEVSFVVGPHWQSGWERWPGSRARATSSRGARSSWPERQPSADRFCESM